MPRDLRFTRAVRAGIATDQHHGAVVPPIHLSSTFAFEGFGQKRQYDYSRSGNPTRDILAEAIADLEGGSTGIITSSGMSAVALVLQLLKPGELIVATHDCYGGTHRLLTHLAKRGLFDVEFRELHGASRMEGGGWSSNILRQPRLVWLETPSNPLLRITDIRAVSDAAHAVGAIVVADNTFLSPAWQQPLNFGADIVVHSTTKYLNGHSDVVGGAVVTKDLALGQELAFWANALGLTGAPFDSYLTLRGIRTLQARCRIHEENALAVVGLLSTHPAVAQVHYPGLPGHSGHAIARIQQQGFGAMVSFELHGGEPAVRAFLHGLEYFTLAESLGGVESLIAHPATMTHVSMGEEGRRVAGISDTLLRLSLGIEEAPALVHDLSQGLARASTAGHPERSERAAGAKSEDLLFGIA